LRYRNITADLIDPTVKLLTDEQNEDGGWSALVGRNVSAAVPSALAICALIAAEPEQQSSHFQSASRYLQGLLSSGWQPLLAQLGSVQAVAEVLKAAAKLKNFPFELLQKGVHFIVAQANEDGAWAERKSDRSSVEVTSVCVLALT